MHLVPSLHRAITATAASAILLTVGCDSPPVLQPDEGPAFNRSANAEIARDDYLKAVRQATSRYNSTVQAVRDGYEPSDHCVAVPGLGGMGYHWVNGALIDDTFNPLQPEALLYATGPGGNLRLVAVEYIVMDVGQAHPSFNGQPFDVGGTPIGAAHWSLHVWLYEHNPSGLYTPFNPAVKCP
jgi:hypothetical protein